MDIIIHHAEVVDMGGQEILMLATETDVDGKIAVLIPREALETRAAEYALDPDDFDTILDVILYSHYLPKTSPDDTKDIRNSETIREARADLLERIATLKGTGKVKGMIGRSTLIPSTDQTPTLRDSGVRDPVEFIKEECPISKEHIAVKQENFRRLRATYQENRRQGRLRKQQEIQSGKTRETAQELRERLFGVEEKDIDGNRKPARTVSSTGMDLIKGRRRLNG